MDLDKDKLKERVRDGEFQAITLDTSIFDSQGLKLESGLLKQLEQFRYISTKLILSEIVKEEIFSHLKNKIEEVRKNFEKSLRQIKEYWIIQNTEVQQAKDLVYKHQDNSEEVAQSQLNKFIQHNHVKIIKAEENVSISKLIHKYFEAKPPFSTTGKKKNEFPDAIALMSLETWAMKNNTKVIAVTSDNDWMNFCQDSQYIVALENLGLALGLFQPEDADDICEYLSNKYQMDGIENIKESIANALSYDLLDFFEFDIDSVSTFYSHEYEVNQVTCNSFDFNYLSNSLLFRPISFDNELLVVESELSINVDIECLFTFDVYDSIDKDYISMGSNYKTIQTDLDITILISLFGNMNQIDGDFEVEDVELENKNSHFTIDFGEVEPYWMENG